MYKQIRFLLLGIILTGCSTEVHPVGVEIDCEFSLYCPLIEDVKLAIKIFDEESLEDFDREAPLLIEWYPDGYIIERRDNFKVMEVTYSPEHIAVTRWDFLFHALTHVKWWRLEPSSRGDDNHDLPGGPWTREDNIALGRMKARLQEELQDKYFEGQMCNFDYPGLD